MADFPPGLVVLPGTPRPQAIQVHDLHFVSYSRIDADANGVVIGFTSEALQTVSHEPCGWTHPTWSDEAEARLASHLTTCEMRTP